MLASMPPFPVVRRIFIRSVAAVSLASGIAVAMPACAQANEQPEQAPEDTSVDAGALTLSALTLSGTVELVSDYRFRGFSSTGGGVALQGSLTLSHASGIYAGAWASNLQDSAQYGRVELDLYAGWSGDVAAGLTADAGLVYYVYPDGHAGHADVFEPYASLSTTVGPATAKLGVAYAWSQAGTGGGDNLYVYTDLGTAIPGTALTLAAHLGHTSGVYSPAAMTGTGTEGGFDWSLGATYAVTPNLSVGASYIGVEGAAIDGFSDDTVVGSVKFTF